jgi:hypothetical protein
MTTDSRKPVAYLEGNDIYFDDEGHINDYIRQNGTPLYTHPASRQALDGQEMTLIKTLVDIRFACGDDGKRMQGELVEFIAELARKAEQWDQSRGQP